MKFTSIIIVVSIQCVFCFSCKKKNNEATTLDKKIIVENSLVKTNTDVVCSRSVANYYHTSKNGFSITNFEVGNLNLELILVDETEKSFLRINENIKQVHFNFTYDTDKESSISEIKIFNCKDSELIILFPTASEELPVYQMIKIVNKNKIIDLGIKSYKVINPEKMFQVNNIENLELINDKYIYKIKEKTSSQNILIYDKTIMNSFEDIYNVLPKVDTYLNLRSSPNIKESKIVGKLYPNDKVFLLNDFGKWSLVFSKNNYGFVSSEFLK